ncbi:CTR copper uptake transporter [Pisolithus thermaeus]|nr:CTR copper uptake transporter [Pisolithus croceorrhizus]KAI6160556.1 CTR copper uptake transporter [Pisolithus thermaeus]
MMHSTLLIGCLLYHAQRCLGSDNGMNMTMDGSMELAAGQMLPYLHFTLGDTLWFLGWVPQSRGAMLGACIGLFLLALLERWLAACKAVIEVHWNKSASQMLADKQNDSVILKNNTADRIFRRLSPPFVAAYDLPRGVIYAALALLNYLFMLTIMTFQLAFIFSLVIGLGVGETLFGRYALSAHLH